MGIAVATAAMVCVLSVMNGFGSVVEEMFSLFDPDLRITAAQGKTLHTNTEVFDMIRQWDEIDAFMPTIEENALVRFSERQVTALVKGVPDDYNAYNAIDSTLVDGEFSVFDGAFERTVMGLGLANTLGIGAHFVSAMRLYAPKRTQRVNMLTPEKSINQQPVWISAVFSVGQLKYDDNYMLVSFNLAKQLFEFQEDEATAVELHLKDGKSVKSVKRRLQRTLGNDYIVADRYEQQKDFFRILKIEKLMTALLLSCIILIAALNIVGALSMLMLDKKDDIAIIESLGASKTDMRDIFLYEGWLISVCGAVAGVLLGTALCWIQMTFGVLKLGNGTNYIISAYPVDIQFFDLVFVLIIVLLLGFISAFIPARQLTKRHKAND